MELSEFRAEAEALSRDSVVLSQEGQGPVRGYWHSDPGEGLCLSVSDRGDWLNIYSTQNGEWVEVTREPAVSACPLFGRPLKSLPPIDAVFLHGSERVQAWLGTCNWARDQPFNSNFPHPTPALYEQVWQSGCPLFIPDVIAVLGGWHFPWPDGDWAELAEQRLVVWTLRGAEPWIEVFADGSDYTVYGRIT